MEASMLKNRLLQLSFAVLSGLLSAAMSACGSSSAKTPEGSTQAPVITAFTASPATITAAQDVTLSWTVTGADTLSIDQSVGPVTGTSKTVHATATTTYTLTATNTTGHITAQTTVQLNPPVSGKVIADYTVAKDSVLRAIPDSYINAARTTFHVAYFHTSHGTHVSYGAFGLPGFKTGDATKFGITNGTPDPNKLDLHDYYASGTPYQDLSQADADWAAWRTQVRTYLDAAANASINVMMWSWCDPAGHSVPNYLSSMQTLINEYGTGGTKIGTGSGKTRTTPVTFIFMTGHANGGDNVGAGKPRDQAKLITDYCTTHNYFCIDYFSIDSHAMNDTYYEDVNDNGASSAYGGNFYQDWQNAHTKGTDWYENRSSPGGSVTYGEHNTQHITANRKAFAFWWVLARIAGAP
jgi:hypothetical protein